MMNSLVVYLSLFVGLCFEAFVNNLSVTNVSVYVWCRRIDVWRIVQLS